MPDTPKILKQFNRRLAALEVARADTAARISGGEWGEWIAFRTYVDLISRIEAYREVIATLATEFDLGYIAEVKTKRGGQHDRR